MSLNIEKKRKKKRFSQTNKSERKRINQAFIVKSDKEKSYSSVNLMSFFLVTFAGLGIPLKSPLNILHSISSIRK